MDDSAYHAEHSERPSAGYSFFDADSSDDESPVVRAATNSAILASSLRNATCLSPVSARRSLDVDPARSARTATQECAPASSADA
ncbi:hypothetical protein Rhopal_007230-T1 [Rhodotorula paludigena]|uniref:Uncharacterized protein n=1 Tax=Rhodotorula paludigena TaxID=86838 RepID=A0AAV5GNJ2_9BASI|nr:hypothetical protein Rhopal_007230-T1 [Rhodotorula paludigena]